MVMMNYKKRCIDQLVASSFEQCSPEQQQQQQTDSSEQQCRTVPTTSIQIEFDPSIMSDLENECIMYNPNDDSSDVSSLTSKSSSGQSSSFVSHNMFLRHRHTPSFSSYYSGLETLRAAAAAVCSLDRSHGVSTTQPPKQVIQRQETAMRRRYGQILSAPPQFPSTLVRLQGPAAMGPPEGNMLISIAEEECSASKHFNRKESGDDCPQSFFTHVNGMRHVKEKRSNSVIQNHSPSPVVGPSSSNALPALPMLPNGLVFSPGSEQERATATAAGHRRPTTLLDHFVHKKTPVAAVTVPSTSCACATSNHANKRLRHSCEGAALVIA